MQLEENDIKNLIVLLKSGKFNLNLDESAVLTNLGQKLVSLLPKEEPKTETPTE